MHELTARHRRKAGSGPPATALIAWISTEPHPRSGTRSGRHRWHTELPRPANTRSAAAAVAACFLLVCGAILGITATISDEFLLPRQASTPSGWDQNSAAAPSSQGASPCPLRRSHQNVGALKPSGKHRAAALCIKAQGVLGMPQSREAGLSATLENRNKPDT